jgi:hypothetical protein
MLDFPCPLEAVMKVISPKSKVTVSSKHLNPVRASLVIVKPFIFFINAVIPFKRKGGMLRPLSESSFMPPAGRR